MGIAREIARLRPNSSGLLPNTNIEAVAASKLTGAVALATQVSGTLPDANAPSGSVIQVVQVFKTDTAVHAAGSFTDISGLSASITPINTNSKILVMFSVMATAYFTTVQLRITRNGTAIGLADSSSSRVQTIVGGHYPSSDENHQSFPWSSCFLDSPSTTSQLTYKIQVKSQDGRQVFINRSGNDADNSNWSMRATSHITLLEISA